MLPISIPTSTRSAKNVPSSPKINSNKKLIFGDDGIIHKKIGHYDIKIKDGHSLGYNKLESFFLQFLSDQYQHLI